MAIAETKQAATDTTPDESVVKDISRELDTLYADISKRSSMNPQSVAAYRAKLNAVLGKIPLKNGKIPAGQIKTKYDRCDARLKTFESSGEVKENVDDIDGDNEDVTLESIAAEIIEHGKVFDEMAKKIDLVSAYAYNENEIATEKANLAMESGEITFESAEELIEEADDSVGTKMQKSVKAALTNSKNYFDKTKKSIGKAVSGESGYQKVIDEARALCKKNPSVASLQVEYKDYTNESDAILKAQSQISKIIAKGKSRKNLTEEDGEKIKQINTDINKKRGNSKGKPATTTLSKAIESLDKVVKTIYDGSKDAAESEKDSKLNVKDWDVKAAKRMSDAISISKRLDREMVSVNLCTALDLKHGINDAIKKGRKEKASDENSDEKSMSESVDLFESFSITDKLQEIVNDMNKPANDEPVEEAVEINVDELIRESVEEITEAAKSDEPVDNPDVAVSESVNDANQESEIDSVTDQLIQEAVNDVSESSIEAARLIQEAIDDIDGNQSCSDTYNDIINESILGVDDEASAIVDEEINADAEESGEGEIDIDAVMSDDEDDDDTGDECASLESVLDELLCESKSKKKKKKTSDDDDDEECNDDECDDDDDDSDEDDDDKKKSSKKKSKKKKDDDEDEGDSDTDDKDETDDADSDGSGASGDEETSGSEEGTDSEGSSEPAESEEPVDESVIEEGVIGKMMSGASNATTSVRIKKLVSDIKKKVAEGRNANVNDDANLDGILSSIAASGKQILSLSSKLGAANECVAEESTDDDIDVDSLIEEAAMSAGTSSNKSGTLIHSAADQIVRYATDKGAMPSSHIKQYYDDVLDSISSCCDNILTVLGRSGDAKECVDNECVDDVDSMIKEAAKEAGFDYDDNSVDYLLRNFDELI